jgi:hypothetical protein
MNDCANPLIQISPQTSPSEQYNKDPWRSEAQIALLIDNIPRTWMVGDLKVFLDAFGSVIKVEIFQIRHVWNSRVQSEWY